MVRGINRLGGWGLAVGCLLCTPSLAATIGPDVVVGIVWETWQLGREGPIGSGTVGLGSYTTACNYGDEPGRWEGLPSTDHPVIVLSMYRTHTVDGSERVEQIGQAWIKHGFGSSNIDECNTGFCDDPLDWHWIGVGCSDTYGASQIRPCGYDTGPMAPRSVIHPWTGTMQGGPELGPGGGCNFNWPAANHIGHEHDEVSHRLQVQDVDLMPALNPGARYFIEGQYIAPHEYDSGNGNQNNNVSYREVEVSGPDVDGLFIFTDLNATFTEQPTINAWTDSARSRIEPAPLAEGRATLAYKVTDLGGDLWHYEYALYNMNLDRSIGAFSVPIPLGVTLSNVGFHAPLNHAPELNGLNPNNDPWIVSTGGGIIRWATDPFDVDPEANAIRFGTTYNFRFDANTPPKGVYATAEYFKVSGSDSVATLGPQALGPQDCNNNGIEDACDLDCSPPCDVPGCGTKTDCDGTGVPDECENDCNANGVADQCDIAGGASTDCTGNGVPDECKPDCDDDGTPDACEVIAGTAQDCNANGVTDSCDLDAGTSLDLDGDGIPDECNACFTSAVPLADPVTIDFGHGTKNRYVSFSVGEEDRFQAIEVSLVSLPGYEYAEGRSMWVQQPSTVTESSGSDESGPAPNFLASTLGCSPYFTDWHFWQDSEGSRVIHVYGPSIIVGATYEVRVVDEGCNYMSGSGFSGPLAVVTSATGDVVGTCDSSPCQAPQGVVNFVDISAVVDKFKNLAGAPIKARADVASFYPSGSVVNLVINFIDISYVVDAFRSLGATLVGPPLSDPCE